MKALLTGCTGQDGTYLSELLLEKGYKVYGIVRRTSAPPRVPKGIEVIEGDVTDPSISDVIAEVNPDEVYNLAGMSYVWESFKVPSTTFDINCFGAIHVMEGARKAGAKFYQASTSEMFGMTPPPHNEQSKFHPRSPYGCAKLAAHWMTINYREAYGMYACAGVLFNHESPLRGHVFLSQKAATAAARIKLRKQHEVVFGNLDAKRDWGHAKDYVKGMWLMLQQPDPKEIVFGTGVNHTAREFVKACFDYVDLDYREFVKFDPKYMRPSEVDELLCDPTEANKLGWSPEYNFQSLVSDMMRAALERESN
jgi:GDPmannose 4,6-dehydratase